MIDELKIKQPSNILVVITRRIGDVLLTTPLIRSLRVAWPCTEIDVLVFEGTEGVLAGNTDISKILTVAQRPTLKKHLGFLWSLWREYDLAISMMPSDRPTFYAFVSGKKRIGLISEGIKHWWKKYLLSRYVLFDNIDTHTVLMNLALVDLLGIKKNYQVISTWNSQDEADVKKLLHFDPEIQPYVVLHLYPMYAYKAWNLEGWIELIDWLHCKGLKIVLTGGNGIDEITYVETLKNKISADVVNVAGKLRFSSVTYLLHKSRGYVGPDTVVTHLAAASGTPTVALFGPSNPVKWGPWPNGYNNNSNPYEMHGTQHVKNVILLQGKGDCVPCMEEGCRRHIKSTSDCLQNLPASAAIDSLSQLLRL